MITFLATLYGLCFGSFANVIIYRLPRGEKIYSPPSRCPACESRLGILDLIPVLSWLILGGKCRYCKAKISVRYTIVETLCAALFAGMAIYSSKPLDVIPLSLFAFTLLSIAFIDAEMQEIPDRLQIFGAVIGILWVLSALSLPDWLNAPTIKEAILGAIAGAAPLLIIDKVCLIILKKDGFGYGDVKLMAMAGIYLGWRLSFTALLFGVVIAGAYIGLLIANHRTSYGRYIAFGPFLVVGIISSLWFGNQFLKWWLPC